MSRDKLGRKVVIKVATAIKAATAIGKEAVKEKKREI